MGYRLVALLAELHARLPKPHVVGPLDVLFGIVLVFANIFALVPPPTRRVRLLRAALAPLLITGWLYLGWAPRLRTPQERWGSAMLFFSFTLKALELLVAFPPEDHVYRLVPTTPGDHPALHPEPVPAGWTRAKLEWATSLWWSWRGIGWNYGPRLPDSSARRPFSRTSTRRAYLMRRTIYLAAVYAADDLASTYMRIRAPDFFITCTTPYADLTTLQRGGHSIATVTRILASLEYSHVGFSLSCVAVGGILGLEGELWSPWGWPPMFASLRDVWQNPGLGYMWSRAWNQYNRRMLHIWGWVGIGERVLGLPPSGNLLHPSQPPGAGANGVSGAVKSLNGGSLNGHGVNGSAKSLNSKGKLDHVLSQTSSTPPESGRASPTAPLEGRRNSTVVSNLIKSAIVFACSALHHDYSSIVMMLDAIGRGETATLKPSMALSLAPFFCLQPFGIALEAAVKRYWRRQKRQLNLSGVRWVSMAECGVGFVWTWIWLGWSAQYFVAGMARLGVWRVYEGYVHRSALWWVW